MTDSQPSRKRPPIDDDAVRNAKEVGSQSFKRLRRCSSTHKQSISASTPFLPCHLTMLRSLYAADSTESSNDERRVDEDMWTKIDVFLQNRESLRKSKGGASQSRGIHEEATLISTADLAAGAPLSQTLQVRPADLSLSSQQMYDRRNSPHKSHRTNIPGGLSFMTQPSSQSHLQGFLSPSSRGNAVAGGDALHPHQQTSSQIDSWALMTTLLKKKSTAADAEAQLSAEPFLPLVSAVDEKLSELRSIRHELAGTKLRADQDRVVYLLSPEGGHDSAQVDGSSSLRVSGDALGKEEETFAMLECKISLWHLLSLSLNDIVGQGRDDARLVGVHRSTSP